MKEGYVISDQNLLHFLTSTLVDWIDLSTRRQAFFPVNHIENHAEGINSEKFMWSKFDFIHLNPVRGGLVEKAAHYLYSSASNYVYKEG